MKTLFTPIVALALLTGCGAGPTDPDVEENTPEALGLDSSKLTGSQARGVDLFFTGSFGGNGRTCATCHSGIDGTLTPAEVQARFRVNPGDPLFRPLDSDDGAGTAYSRMKADATIRVTLKLPANVSLADAPGARTVTLNRGVPTTFNTPALDPVLMADGRAPTLEAQALDAIHSHAQSRTEPTPDQLKDIAGFEKLLFTSGPLAYFANGGPAPTLPTGNTASEKRGREFFNPTGLCGGCHGGPMLNQNPRGSHFGTAFVSALNPGKQPLHTYVFTNPDGTTASVASPDPGLALTVGSINAMGIFKTPQLWGIKNTAPYFHDNSAKTLTELMDHYGRAFDAFGFPHLTTQDKADIIAYMKLL